MKHLTYVNDINSVEKYTCVKDNLFPFNTKYSWLL